MTTWEAHGERCEVRGAIASVEIFARREDEPTRRLTLTIAAPERERDATRWACRVVLADLHRPHTVAGESSLAALVAALDVAREWIAELRAQGFSLARDRKGETPFELP